MIDQERWIFAGDEGDRIGPRTGLLFFLHRSADQLRFRGISRLVIHGTRERAHFGKIRRSKEIADGLYGAGLFEVETFIERLIVAGGTQHSNQMTAGRGAPSADPRRIEIVLFCIRPQKSDGGLTVLDLSGKDGVLAEPIVDTGDGKPGLFQDFVAVRRHYCIVTPKTDKIDILSGLTIMGTK